MVKRDDFLKIGLTETPQSYWTASTPETNYPSLEEDISVDAAIVGGGMVGITTALLLKREGMRVAVIEADRILQGTTAHTTAKVTSQHNLIYARIAMQMGEEKARQYAEANESAIKFIADLIEEKKIDCDFERRSAYVYTHEDSYVQQIKDEAETASRLGIKATYLEQIPLPFEVKGAVCFDGQAQFHPRKYLLSLAADIPDDGSYIFENTRAVDIEEGSMCLVVADSGKKVKAKNVIIASHYPFYDGMGFYFARLYPERSYALGVKMKERLPRGMYITAEDPGRSLRSQKFDSGELVLVVGEHHKTGQGGATLKHYEALRDFAQSAFDVIDIPYRWSTQDYNTADGVPYIGHLTKTTPNIYAAAGFGKWGMTNSTASSMIIRDLIVKGESPWEPVYNPSRFTPSASAKTFIKENANVAGRLISGKLTPVPHDLDVEEGQGKIMGVDGQRTGVYRDEKGTLHLVDTTCTHMGCELSWNEAEKSWDCPCHGSRFTYEGEIIDGPALKTIKLHKDTE
jgi:glycine/D-amino acid oxidase-like deaminating enzyme/nitrite reductase/ring-hydroxylating ferredoxin subunit